MKPVRVRGTLRLETEIGKGMWESHRIITFLNLGKEKALTVFPPTLVWFFIWSTGCTARGWFSPMQVCIMRFRPSLTVYIIAHIALGVSRLLATSGDDFLSSGCAGQGMLSCPSLTVYIIARIDLGVSRHCAPTFRGRFAPGRVPMTFCGVYRAFRARRAVRHPVKTIKWAKVHSERIDRNHHL